MQEARTVDAQHLWEGIIMLRRQWLTATLATAGLLAAGPLVRAGDTFRLGLDQKDAPTLTLGGADASDADTYEVGRGGGGGHGGGGRGGGGFHGGGRGGGYHAAYRGGGGYRGGYGRGGYGYGRGGYGYGRGGYGYGRGWYGGYGRGWYGGYGRGWYGGYGNGWYGGWGWPYYYGGYGYPYGWGYSSYWPYYSGSPYYSAYYSPSYVYPSTTVVAPPVGLSGAPVDAQTLPDPSLETAPFPGAVPPAGTFPYDGGPRNPPPMPRAEPAPMGAPAVVPSDGRAVSLPLKAKYSYLAYGETANVAPADRTNTYLIKANPSRPTGR
jgi:hypothetical protein